MAGMKDSAYGDTPLFGWSNPARGELYPNGPGYKSSGPSQQAAEKIAPVVGKLQHEVIAELRKQSDLTADEIAQRINRSPFSVRPRCAELKATGIIVASPERGRNISGMTANRWRLASEDGHG